MAIDDLNGDGQSDVLVGAAGDDHQYQTDDMKIVAHGQWWNEHTFEMTWQFVETAWVDHVVLRFYEDRISVDRRTNANYAPLVAPTLQGKIANE